MWHLRAHPWRLNIGCLLWAKIWLSLIALISQGGWDQCGYDQVVGVGFFGTHPARASQSDLCLHQGLRLVSGCFAAIMHEGTCANMESQFLSRRASDWTYWSHVLECNVTTKPYRSILTKIMTWTFKFHPTNDINLYNDIRNKSRLTCYFHCYVTWRP